MYKKRILVLGILVVIVLIFILGVTSFNFFSYHVNSDMSVIAMADNSDLSLKKGDKIKLNIMLFDLKSTSENKLYKWNSSDRDVASVDKEGNVVAKKAGRTVITATLGNDVIRSELTVFDIKDVIIVVGDSRMDNFKDDNNFNETDKYEIKYIDGDSKLFGYDRFYVVSLSGKKYDWLAGEDRYKDENATKYVRELIKEYENKTSDTVKYNVKILFNLGVNDLSKDNLGDNLPSDIASKYLTKLDYNMHNDWHSDILNRISLNMVTLFPVDDEQVKCYFPGRYDSDVKAFNDYIKSNSDYYVCDAYNDLDFSADVFREAHGNDSCAVRDGLHFSKDFNREKLLDYFVNVCANK